MQGLPEGVTFRDPSEMGETNLTSILKDAEKIQIQVVAECRGQQEGVGDGGNLSEGNSVRTERGESNVSMENGGGGIGCENNDGRNRDLRRDGTDDVSHGAGHHDVERDGVGDVERNGVGNIDNVRCDGDVMCASKKKTSILKRKRKETREHAKKKKNVYEKCNAFLCHEPPVNEDTGMLDWILCDTWYHWDCVGILKRPSGNFFCGCDKTLF